ncbi:antibiotic biosynthesis monooxygenase [Neorhizobium sp. P12A]|jgi:quinol monooxygenase YgiN|uniref:putative quinol monooxygenase n=1 Tax=Rhizobium/Agrobacterium group TaxID=227290 RepID=UPI0010453510|nr:MULTISPECIES: putative quinol monooxygenase [Rhizobium/Agrobacterium group]KAA0697779.1 antibiotic biosynthesis monooxygenase [Neorhizobium sp. P12A]TCR88021.1 quinol monooxygenase YgiN [Rhizobium sp. BK376]
MSEQLTVIAHLVARPDKIEDTKAFLMSLIERTRAEAGCLDYHLHQSEEDPANFAFYENWTSREALDEHMETPYLRELVARKAEFFKVDPDIRLLTMISPR